MNRRGSDDKKAADGNPGTGIRFPDRSGLRSELPPCEEGAAETVKAIREQEDEKLPGPAPD